MASEFHVVWNEDAGATVLGRIAARNASGAQTGVSGEGRWIKQADVSSITCKVFDLDSATQDVAIATPTVTVAEAVLDTPLTSADSNSVWTKDSYGYNFIHDLAASCFPTGGHAYRVEYEVTLAGGAKFHGAYSGVAKPIRGS